MEGAGIDHGTNKKVNKLKIQNLRRRWLLMSIFKILMHVVAISKLPLSRGRQYHFFLILYPINIMAQKVIYHHVYIISKKVIYDSYHIIYP
jgi:hypothetical protein